MCECEPMIASTPFSNSRFLIFFCESVTAESDSLPQWSIATITSGCKAFAAFTESKIADSLILLKSDA